MFGIAASRMWQHAFIVAWCVAIHGCLRQGQMHTSRSDAYTKILAAKAEPELPLQPALLTYRGALDCPSPAAAAPRRRRQGTPSPGTSGWRGAPRERPPPSPASPAAVSAAPPPSPGQTALQKRAEAGQPALWRMRNRRAVRHPVPLKKHRVCRVLSFTLASKLRPRANASNGYQRAFRRRGSCHSQRRMWQALRPTGAAAHHRQGLRLTSAGQRDWYRK